MGISEDVLNYLTQDLDSSTFELDQPAEDRFNLLRHRLAKRALEQLEVDDNGVVSNLKQTQLWHDTLLRRGHAFCFDGREEEDIPKATSAIFSGAVENNLHLLAPNVFHESSV